VQQISLTIQSRADSLATTIARSKDGVDPEDEYTSPTKWESVAPKSNPMSPHRRTTQNGVSE